MFIGPPGSLVLLRGALLKGADFIQTEIHEIIDNLNMI